MKKTHSIIQFSTRCSVIAAFAVLAGCATDKAGNGDSAKTSESQPEKVQFKDQQYNATPATVKLGEFTSVELKETALTPKDAKNDNNRESAKRIDGMLLTGLKEIWPDIRVIPAGGEFSQNAERTLQITPSITNIKLKSVGTRIWLGAMAGGSDIVMHVDYADSATGQVIANPDFWKGNNAWSGAWSFGASDNQIRDAVVSQILAYTAGNK